MHICVRLNTYQEELAAFFHASKSADTFYTTLTAEIRTQLNVQVPEYIILTTNYLKILGVTFDSMFKSTKLSAEN